MAASSPTIFYVSHPQVRIDPEVPVPHWGLSDFGRSRVAAARKAAWCANVRSIISSFEVKAMETAAMFGEHLGVVVRAVPDMHENDRSATGFVPPAEFELLADAFFGDPKTSVRGWERAVDAQRRMIVAFEAALAEATDAEHDVLIVGHGGVGTLLYCHLSRLEISRSHDQGPGGGGNVIRIDRATRKVLHGWERLEELD